MNVREHEIFPDEFPESWASDWGEDEYGLFMGFTYKGVRQDFRWIEPGTFQMGSPKDEVERYIDEIQHEVELTRGFWLADTTVTQELWNSVMEDNPSRFIGVNRPVEQVSWEEVLLFINKLNSVKPELRLSLPTEAEWEYCCRAGEQTLFNFGEKSTVSLDNFNYSGKWGEERHDGQTKEVKSYKPNAWGLFEMHGNVSEWCFDFYGEYPASRVINPEGSISGVDRVLRGGSWFSNGRDCRSTHRSHSVQNSKDDDIGFRLARSHRAIQSI